MPSHLDGFSEKTYKMENGHDIWTLECQESHVRMHAGWMCVHV
jgi:hypothetical protein